MLSLSASSNPDPDADASSIEIPVDADAADDQDQDLLQSRMAKNDEEDDGVLAEQPSGGEVPKMVSMNRLRQQYATAPGLERPKSTQAAYAAVTSASPARLALSPAAKLYAEPGETVQVQ